VFNAVFTYFVIFALAGSQTTAFYFLTGMYCAQLVSVALFIWLCIRFHPAPSYRMAVSLFAAGTVALLLAQGMGLGATWWIVAALCLAGLGRGGLNYIPWSVYNYMADVDEIVTGRRREGAFAGVMTFVRKTMQAGAVMLVGLLLQAGGFVSGSKTQSPDAINTILLVMGVGTLAVLTFGFIVSLRFRLNRETHEVLMSEIERFKTRPGSEPSVENRRVVEDLSGWPYEKLWGRGDSRKR
jgi:oligogalacturonide transporter